MTAENSSALVTLIASDTCSLEELWTAISCFPAYFSSQLIRNWDTVGERVGESLRVCDGRTNPSSEEETDFAIFFSAYFTVNKELRNIAENVSIQAAAEFPANGFGIVREKESAEILK